MLNKVKEVVEKAKSADKRALAKKGLLYVGTAAGIAGITYIVLENRTKLTSSVCALASETADIAEEVTSVIEEVVETK